jgi:uncharacterized protein
MSAASVEILGDLEIRICCPSAFTQEHERLRFLEEVFTIPAIRSVEIDPIQGIAVMRRHPRSESLLTILKILSEKLSSRTAGQPKGAQHVMLPRKKGPLGFVHLPPEMHGVRKPIYRTLGIFFVGMSVVGVMSPFIPTSPFVLLSSYFLIRSSRALHDRLIQNRIFGPIIDDFYVQGGLRWPMKRNSLIFMGAGFVTFSTLSGFAPGMVISMASASLISFTLLMSLPTVKGSDQQFQLTA